MNSFPYHLDFHNTNFRENPHLYRIGKGEQGVLLVQPYKSEILPHWRFKNPKVAKKSARKIYKMFKEYLEEKDFIGADMARKYLQMGFTRARRYANHKSGRKYEISEGDNSKDLPYPYSSGSRNIGNDILPLEEDNLTNEKAQSAEIFKKYWFRAKDNKEYKRQKEKFRNKYYL